MAGFYLVRDGGQIAKLSSASLTAPTTTSSSISTPTTLPVQTSTPTMLDSPDINIHSCKLCRRKFTNPSNWIAHMKDYHHVDPEQVEGAEKGEGATTTKYIPIAPKLSVSAMRVGTVASTPDNNTNLVTKSSISNKSGDATNLTELTFAPSGTGILSSDQVRQACSLIVEKSPGLFTCLACHLPFISRENGITHSRRQHLGERPYTCGCGSRFALAHTRNQHKKICHLGESGLKSQEPLGSTMFFNASAVGQLNSTNTIRRPLPVTVMTPSILGSAQPFFYRNTQQEDSLPKNTAYTGESILPESPSSLGGMETEAIPESDSNNDNLYSRRIVEPKVHSRKEILSNRLDVSETTTSTGIVDLHPFIAKDGILTDHQIEFADKMQQKEIINGKVWFRCKICQQRLSAATHCKNHIRHIHLQEHYKCYYCDKRFVSKGWRDKHRLRFHGRRDNAKQSVTIIQSQIFVNQRQGSVKSKVSKESPGIHPSNLPAYIASYVGRRGDRFECKKCRKQFVAEKNLKNHCRQLHFGRSHLCTSCGLYFEQGLNLHREKCLNPDRNNVLHQGERSTSSSAGLYSAEVGHLTSIMNQSVDSTMVNGVETSFQCRLCTTTPFEKRNNAEAHVWIEHIRSKWVVTCGSKNVDEIYLQFLKAQFVRESAASTTSDYVYAGSIEKAVYSNNQEETQAEMNYEETEEEMPFDPLAFCNSEIFVEEASSSLFSAGKNGDDPMDDSINCDVEVQEDSYHDSPVETPQFKIVGYDNARRSNTIDSDSDFVPSIISVEGSVGTKINSSASLSQEQVDELNMKALRFIREKTGQYHCIVCRRTSNLRRKLVEHVRKVHLLGEVEDQEEEEGARGDVGGNGKLGRNAPDSLHRMYCRYCEEYFDNIRHRADHERHCSNRNKGTTPEIPVANISNILSRSTLPAEERAARFVRVDRNEFSCTICNIRSTARERVIMHIRKIHFGDDDLQQKTKGRKTSGRPKSKIDATFRPTAPSISRPTFLSNKLKSTFGMRQGSSQNDASLRLAVRREPGKPVGNLMVRPQPQSTRSSSVRDKDERTITTRSRDSIKVTRSSSIDSNSSTEAINDEEAESQTPVRNLGDATPQNIDDAPKKEPTSSEIEEAKNMIVPWSVGGKYSFSKCKECNMLFTKYANAEAHALEQHCNRNKGSTEVLKDTSSTKVKNTTLPNTGESSPELTKDDDDDNDKDDDNDDGNHMDDFDNYNSGDDNDHEVQSPSSLKTSLPAADDEKQKSRQPIRNLTPSSPTKTRPFHCVPCDRRFMYKHHLTAHKKKCKKGIRGNSEKAVTVQSLAMDRNKIIEQAENGVLTKEQEDAAELQIETLSRKGKMSRNRCRICSIVIRGHAPCLRHVRILHYGEKANQCPFCKERFSYKQTLDTHALTCDGTSGKTPVKSQDNSKMEKQEQLVETFPGSSSSSSKNKLYRCKLCGDEIEDKPFIMYHLVSAHHEDLKTMGMKTSLEFMETMIDSVQPESKSNVSESVESSENKKVTRTSTVAKKHLKLPSKSTTSKKEPELRKSLDSLNPHSPSTSLGDGIDTNTPKKRTRTVRDKGVMDSQVDWTPIKVYKNRKEVLQNISEKGYYLMSDGEMEVLYPSYIVLERLKFRGSVPPNILIAVKKLVEKRGNNGYRCKKCGSNFQTYNGCTKHIRKIHYGHKNSVSADNSTTSKPQMSSSSQPNKSKNKRRNSDVDRTEKVEEKKMELVDLLEIVFNRAPNFSGIITDEEIAMAHSLIQSMRNSKKFACAACDVNDEDYERICRHAREIHFGQNNEEKRTNTSSTTKDISKAGTSSSENLGAGIKKPKKRKSRTFLSLKKKKKVKKNYTGAQESTNETLDNSDMERNEDDNSVFIRKEKGER